MNFEEIYEDQFLYLLPKGKRYKVNQVDTKAFAFVTPDQFLFRKL